MIEHVFFRPRTPIPEESSEENDQASQEVKPEPVQLNEAEVQTEKSEKEEKDEQVDSKSDASTDVIEEDNKNVEEKAGTSKTPQEKPKIDEEPPRKPLGPTKIGGKSKLTGEILTGWL